MPRAKIGLVDYIARNPSVKAKQITSNDEHFELATISKIRGSLQQLIEHRVTSVLTYTNTGGTWVSSKGACV